MTTDGARGKWMKDGGSRHKRGERTKLTNWVIFCFCTLRLVTQCQRMCHRLRAAVSGGEGFHSHSQVQKHLCPVHDWLLQWLCCAGHQVHSEVINRSIAMMLSLTRGSLWILLSCPHLVTTWRLLWTLVSHVNSLVLGLTLCKYLLCRRTTHIRQTMSEGRWPLYCWLHFFKCGFLRN